MQRKCKLLVGRTFLFGAQTGANSTCSEPLHLCRPPSAVAPLSALHPESLPFAPMVLVGPAPDGETGSLSPRAPPFPTASELVIHEGEEEGRAGAYAVPAPSPRAAKSHALVREDEWTHTARTYKTAFRSKLPQVRTRHLCHHSTRHPCAPSLMSEIPGCSLSLSRVRSASTPSSVEKVLPPLSDPERASSDLAPTSHAGHPTITQTPVGLSPPLRLRSRNDRRSEPSPRGLTSRTETRPREQPN